jgi:hypothetical protein
MSAATVHDAFGRTGSSTARARTRRPPTSRRSASPTSRAARPRSSTCPCSSSSTRGGPHPPGLRPGREGQDLCLRGGVQGGGARRDAHPHRRGRRRAVAAADCGGLGAGADHGDKDAQLRRLGARAGDLAVHEGWETDQDDAGLRAGEGAGGVKEGRKGGGEAHPTRTRPAAPPRLSRPTPWRGSGEGRLQGGPRPRWGPERVSPTDSALPRPQPDQSAAATAAAAAAPQRTHRDETTRAA